MGIPLDQADALIQSQVIDTSHVRFDLQNAPPASEIFVSEDDLLVLVVYNSVPGLTVNVSYRHLDPSGALRLNTWRTTPSSDRAANTRILSLAEGYLLGLSVYPSGASPKRGQTFVSLRVVRGGQAITDPVALLISDYLAAGQLLGHPWSLLRQSVEGPGFLRGILATSPAMGNPFLTTVPTGARWRLWHVNVTLSTSLVVGDRTLILSIWVGGQDIGDIPSTIVQPANTTWGYFFGAFGVTYNVPVGLTRDVLLPLHATLYQLAGDTIYISVSGMDPGDRILNPILAVEEWIET